MLFIKILWVEHVNSFSTIVLHLHRVYAINYDWNISSSYWIVIDICEYESLFLTSKVTNCKQMYALFESGHCLNIVDLSLTNYSTYTFHTMRPLD